MAYLTPPDPMSVHPDPDWAGYFSTSRNVMIDEAGRQHDLEPDDEGRFSCLDLHTGHSGVAVTLDYDASPAGGGQ